MEYDEYNSSNNSYTCMLSEEDLSNSLPPVFWTILTSLPTIIALLSNVLLLVVLCSAPPRLSTTSNVIFLQRAIANLLYAIAMIFFIAGTSAADIMVRGSCITFSVMIHVGAVASNMFLMAFTVDSYLAAYPQHHAPPSRRKTMRVTSALAWALAAATGIAGVFLTEAMGKYCTIGPFFSVSDITIKAIEMVMFLVPLIVSWVFVSVALPPRPYLFPTEATVAGEKGPNRSLMLGLTSTFTVAYGPYWIFQIVLNFGYIDGWLSILYFIIILLPTLSEAVNPILVICLTEDLRQKVAGWLPSRSHAASLPLGEL